ncbi:hypothetical protein [Streptomyces sp. NPDC058613]|uniref:hypothetical protein n=1 Tax=Streptomyces sp. NPDC058613 TaxID=3346556 RepID=UPI00365127FD
MADTIEDLSEQLREIKAALLYDERPVTAKYDTDHQEKDPNKQAKDEVFYVGKLKLALIDERPRIVTDAMLPFDFIPRFAEMYEELQKEKSSELLEAFGLDGIGAAVEKYHEGHKAKLQYAIFAGLGIFVPLAIGAAVLVFRRLILEGFRTFQLWLTGHKDPSNPDSKRSDTGKAFVVKENLRGFERVTKAEIQRREDAAGGGMASIPRNADFGPLRAQLEALNPHLATFNRHAPGFVSNFKKLPSQSRATKAGEGVKAVSGAIAGINHQTMASVARGMGKITGAVKNSDPKKTRQYADAIGKLTSALGRLNTDKVKDSATAIGSLKTSLQNFSPATVRETASATRTLASRFADLKSEARQLTSILG